MAQGLSDLWGLAESKVSDVVSEVQQQARAAMDEALGAVNSSLQSAITDAPPEDHAALSADRDKVIEAYQMASSQMGKDEAAGQSAMDRVLAAAGSLGGKAAQSAEASAAAHGQWAAHEAQFDDMMLHVNELKDAGHPKSDTLEQVCQMIREKADGRCYGDCNAAIEEFGPKLESIMQQFAAPPDHEFAEDEEIAAPVHDGEGTRYEGIVAQAGAAASEEKSWWDQVKEKAEDVYHWAAGDAAAEAPVLADAQASGFNMEEEHGEWNMEEEQDGWNMEDEHREPGAEQGEGDQSETATTATLNVAVVWWSAGNMYPVDDGTLVRISPAVRAGQPTMGGFVTFQDLEPGQYTVTAAGRSIAGEVSGSESKTLKAGDVKPATVRLVGVPAGNRDEGPSAGGGQKIEGSDCSYPAVLAYLIAHDPSFATRWDRASRNVGKGAAHEQENLIRHVHGMMRKCELGRFYVPPKD